MMSSGLPSKQRFISCMAFSLFRKSFASLVMVYLIRRGFVSKFTLRPYYSLVGNKEVNNKF